MEKYSAMTFGRSKLFDSGRTEWINQHGDVTVFINSTYASYSVTMLMLQYSSTKL